MANTIMDAYGQPSVWSFYSSLRQEKLRVLQKGLWLFCVCSAFRRQGAWTTSDCTKVHVFVLYHLSLVVMLVDTAVAGAHLSIWEFTSWYCITSRLQPSWWRWQFHLTQTFTFLQWVIHGAFVLHFLTIALPLWKNVHRDAVPMTAELSLLLHSS